MVLQKWWIFRQLSQEERVEMYSLREQKYSFREIARRLQRHHTTISREFSRNSSKALYQPLQAHHRHLLRKRKANQGHIKLRRDTSLRSKIFSLLIDTALGWWPDEILWRLRIQGRDVVSTPTLYRYIHSSGRSKLLRHGKCWYRTRYKRENRWKMLFDGVASIEQRDKQIERRDRIGDREWDTVLSSNRSSWLVTLVERKSRYLLMRRVSTHQSKEVCNMICELLATEQVSTLTTDHGKEFSGLRGVENMLGIVCYRAHPYASYERWTNERTNGLIRRYLPKGCDMSKYSEKEIEDIRDRLNRKPRKILGYRTPYEVYHNIHLSSIP